MCFLFAATLAIYKCHQKFSLAGNQHGLQTAMDPKLGKLGKAQQALKEAVKEYVPWKLFLDLGDLTGEVGEVVKKMQATI